MPTIPVNIIRKCAGRAIMLLTLGILAQPVLSSELTSARAINSYYTEDNFTANDKDPYLASDGQGRLLSLWTSTKKIGYNEKEPILSTASSTTSGTTWNPTVSGHLLVGSDLDDAGLVYAGQDTWSAVFSIREQDNGRSLFTLVAARSSDLGQTWSEPVALPMPAEQMRFVHNLQVESDGNGNVLALWSGLTTSTADSQAYLSRSTDMGQTWSAAQELDNVSTLWSAMAKLAYAGAGRWVMVHAVDTEISGEPAPWADFRISNSDDLGENWTDAGLLFQDQEVTSKNFDIDAANGEVVVLVDAPSVVSDLVPETYGNSFTQDGTAVWVSDDSGTTFTSAIWLIAPTRYGWGESYGKKVRISGDAQGNWSALVCHDTTPVWTTSDAMTAWTLSTDLEITPPLPGMLAASQQLPTMAAAGDGDFAVLCSLVEDPENLQKYDSDIFSFVTLNTGTTWQDPVTVSKLPVSSKTYIDDGDVDIAASDNILVAVWSAGPVTWKTWNDIMVSRSYDDGLSWTHARPIPGAHGYYTRLIHTGGQTFTCYWFTEDGYKQSTSINGGITWGDVTDATEPSPINEPIVRSLNNDLIRVRSEVIPEADNYFTINTYTDISTDDGVTWHDTALVYSHTRLCAQFGNDHFPNSSIIYLGQGRLVTLVKDYWIGRVLPFDTNRLLNVDLLLVESFDNGRTWGPAMPVYSGVQIKGTQTPLRVSNDRVIVSWSQWNSGLPESGLDSDVISLTRQFGENTAASDWQLFE